MRTFTYCIALAMWMTAIVLGQAQENAFQKLENLEASKEAIVNEEKDLLKREVEAINLQLSNGQITAEEAEQQKKQAAEKHALNIENRLAIVDNKIALLQRNDGDIVDDGDRVVLRFGTGDDEDGFVYLGKKYRERKYDRRTSSHLMFSFGLNNAIGDGQSLNDSDFKVGGSRYAEIGLAWKTRVFKNSNWLRVMYGVSFQFNGLKPTDNRFFVDTGEQTELQTFDLNLDKSKFRMDNLVVPVHFEFGPSKKIEGKDYFRYSTHDQFRIGIGGYAGVNLGSRQKLRFNDNGEEVKQKLKGNYNTNNFIYGLSAYVGFSDLSVYAKYDLNPIFRNNPTDIHNVSLGLRWDWD